MLFVYVHLIKLFIAPQWWLEPFIGIRVDLFLYPLWLVYVFLTGRIGRLLTFDAIEKYFILFWAWLILSILINPKNDLSVQHAVQYTNWLLLFKLMRVTIDDRPKLFKFIFALVACVGILVVEGIDHKLSEDGLGWANQGLGWVQKEVIEAGGTGRTRWVSIFDGPGVFCIAYTTALPFVILAFRNSQGIIAKTTGSVIILAFIIAIYFTGSRGGFLATLSILVISFLYIYKPKIKILAVTSLAIISVFALAPSHLTNTKDSSNSAQHRVDMWGKGANMFRYNYIDGIGRGNYKRYSHRLIAHNSTIELMAETGFFGTFFWLSLLYLSIKAAVLNYLFINKKIESREHSNANVDTANLLYKERELHAATAISIVGYYVNSIFVTAEFETLYMLLAISAIGCSINKIKIDYSVKEKVIVASVIVAIYIFTKVFVKWYFS